MKITFNVNWGYQMLYSRRLYHPEYRWDGCIECSDKEAKLHLSLLHYPVCWWGLPYSPVLTPISGNSWENIVTRRGYGGLQVEAECAEDAVFTVHNQYGDFTFTAEQLQNEGRKVWPLGPKYGFCTLTVTRKGYLWFKPSAEELGVTQWEPADTGLPVEEHRRLEMAKLVPGGSLKLDMTAEPECEAELVLHIAGMALRNKPGEVLPGTKDVALGDIFTPFLSPEGIRDYIDREMLLRVTLDDGTVKEMTHYYRFHDLEVQLLEDVWFKIPVKGSIRSFTLQNMDGAVPLWISKITAAIRKHKHLELELPKWILAGKTAIGRIYSASDCSIELSTAHECKTIKAQAGWNEIRLECPEPALNYPVTAKDGDAVSTAVLPAVYALEPEYPEIMVGCDFTTVPHDDYGDMDSILEYISRTQMGNTVVFRAFRPYPNSKPLPEDALMKRWGEYCKEHNIYVQSVNCHGSGALSEAAGNYMHNAGDHEFAGGTYAADPSVENPAADMREASLRYMKYVSDNVGACSQPSFRFGYGDAGGGARYLFQAGLEYIRAETMVPHTQHLCSLVRPASRIWGAGDWGVHIAIQHSSQPYQEDWHLGQYFLSLYQAWMMGASNIYEEDSLFILFKEEQQSWDDKLTKGKRALTRDFFRFASTHPRRGQLQLNIASLEGRYAAPFNGFICGPEQDPSYSVWGLYGNPAPEWGHAQPEKMRHLLDVLMPGASAHPLRQKPEKRRFYFSGTPFGDFDQLPVEAGIDAFLRYKLILNLGWHSANSADQAKLDEFVRRGGTYFAGLGEYSTLVNRSFLKDFDDLALWRQGDLSDFCGIKVRGKGPAYSGAYQGFSGDESSSRLCNFTEDEDGVCRLADVELTTAEAVVRDAGSSLPLIVRNKVGKGWVYTLCTWSYPGHEGLSGLMAAWLRKLCGEFKGSIYVEDESGEVFWNVRDCGHYKIAMMLNTDWTVHGNVKNVRLVTPGLSCAMDVVERLPKIVYILKDTVIETNGETHLEIGTDGTVTAHGTEDCEITVHQAAASRKVKVSYQNQPFTVLGKLKPDTQIL